jgi:hypothetical protein
VVIFRIKKGSARKQTPGNNFLQHWSLENKVRFKAQNKVHVDLLCQDVRKRINDFLKTYNVETAHYDVAMKLTPMSKNSVYKYHRSSLLKEVKLQNCK